MAKLKRDRSSVGEAKRRKVRRVHQIQTWRKLRRLFCKQRIPTNCTTPQWPGMESATTKIRKVSFNCNRTKISRRKGNDLSSALDRIPHHRRSHFMSFCGFSHHLRMYLCVLLSFRQRCSFLNVNCRVSNFLYSSS